MKLSCYIICLDGGFAPNPFGHHCTLACCKPAIRRNAEVGDIVVGLAGANYPHAGRLVYAMRVKEVLPLQDYWKDPRFDYRKPSPDTPISQRGDNIWRQDSGGHWHLADHAIHVREDLQRDIGGVNALISTEFFYFGREAIPLDEFSEILAVGRGHKNIHDPDLIERFWKWLHEKAKKAGRHGDPSDFSHEATCVRHYDPDDDIDDCDSSG